jgi:hypothetical protein
MNAKLYAQKIYWNFQQITSSDDETIDCCFKCLEFIKFECDSRFIDFWNDVEIELELIKKNLSNGNKKN